MAQFLNDTLTASNGTALTAHTGETGATWAYAFQSGTPLSTVTIDSNAGHGPSTTGTASAYASGTPAAADYDVVLTAKLVTDNDSTTMGPSGRMSTGADTCYHARYILNGNQLQLFKFIAGTGTQLGSNFSTAITTGDQITLRMSGDQISVLLNGTTVIGPITDTAITAAGKAGFRHSGTATSAAGLHIDAITASDLATVPVNTGAPVVSGTRVVGYTLSTDNGAWTNSPSSFTYQWKQDGNSIGGATTSTYVPVSGDIGHAITCAVVAVNGSGSSSPATSNSLTILAAMVTADAPWAVGGASGLGGAPGATITDPRALFPDITNQQAISGGSDYSLMYVKNTHGAQSLNTAVAWISSQSSSASTDVQIGVATEAAGVNVATIADHNTAPAGVTFTAPSSSGTGLSLGDIPAGSFKGLWVKWNWAPGATVTGSDSAVFSTLGTPT